MKGYIVLLIGLVSSVIFYECKSLASGANNLNAFTVAQDKELGDQVAGEIASKPTEYPILPEAGNQEIYNYIRGMKNTIINSGKVKYKNEFPWEVKIIKDDKTLNAFCTPGGHIYVYTGLIKFLDSEDQLMGVMGNKTALGQIAETVVGGLAGLSFSRANESEADSKSVEYLCGSSINAAGAAGFFKKMEGEKQPPTFLSTHPAPANRIANIEKKARNLNCAGSLTNTSVYQKKKAKL